MEEIEDLGPLEINPVFAPLESDNINDKRYYHLYGGRGSGKSFAASIASVEWTYSEYNHRILYLRQTMTTIEDSSLADIRKAIKILCVEDDFKESKGVIINKTTGSTISFKGIKSSNKAHTAKLKSLSGVTILVIEEAEEVESFAEFAKIDESIREAGKPLKIVLIYNPTSSVTSWIHEKWFTQGRPNSDRFKDTIFMHSIYLDNIEHLNPSTAKMYEDTKESDPIYYKQTILAEWTLEVQGRIYGGWKEYERFANLGEVWYGLDFGYGGSDNTALIKINYFDSVYYVTEMFCKNDLEISDTYALMKKIGVPKDALIYADSAVPTLYKEIRKNGFKKIRPAKKGKVEPLIKKVQDLPIVMVGKNPNLYFDYQSWSRNEKGKLPHEPDTLAALRYGILSKRPTRNIPLHTRSNKHVLKKRRQKGSFL